MWHLRNNGEVVIGLSAGPAKDRLGQRVFFAVFWLVFPPYDPLAPAVPQTSRPGPFIQFGAACRSF